MAGGWAGDGAVQEQISHSLEDEVARARAGLPQGESLLECRECGEEIPQARRRACPGVKLCLSCQVDLEKHSPDRFFHGNRRGNKDSQLR